MSPSTQWQEIKGWVRRGLEALERPSGPRFVRINESWVNVEMISRVYVEKLGAEIWEVRARLDPGGNIGSTITHSTYENYSEALTAMDVLAIMLQGK